MFAGGEVPEDGVQAARVVGALEAGDARPVVAGRRRDPGPGHGDEPGLVVRVVLHVLGQDLQAVEAGGQPGGDGRRRPAGQRRVALAEEAGGVGGRVGGHQLGPGQLLGQEPAALGGGHRDGGHPLHVGQGRARGGHQVEVDVEHDLALDAQVEVEDQAVDDVPDGALDGVLQGDEAQVDGAPADRLEDVDQGGERGDVGTGVGRLGQERLLGEGALGPEEADPHRGRRRTQPEVRRGPWTGRIVNIMDELALQRLLDEVRSGACSPDDAVLRLRRLPFADLGFAKVDHHRSLRQGLPEAVYGQGKTAAQCSAIVGELLGDGSGDRLGAAGDPHRGPTRTRSAGPWPTTPAGTRTVTGRATGADQVRGELSTVVWRPAAPRLARTLVVTAGTSDLPVARECEATLVALGLRPTLLADCGVAGVHRLLASADELAETDAVVVVAGMEGALASLVGGITPAPVVAVPTSTGYGAALEGVTALLAMHASCAAGITVVGIDNGFGAACAVARMLP